MAEDKKPSLRLTPYGVTGLPTWTGRIYDEELRELEGDQGRRILREMSEQDPIIGGTLLGIEFLARQVPWTMNPADDTKKAKDVADFVDGCLTDMYPTFGNTLSEILTMLVFGWAWLEINYKRRNGYSDNLMKNSRYDDGKIGWSGWSPRAQETLFEWEWSGTEGRTDEPDTGYVTAMIQWAPPNFRSNRIPRAKSLHFTTRGRKQNPEGVSLLRNAYRPWYMKKNIEVIEAIGIERDLAGLPVLWAPEHLFAAEKSAEDQALFDTLRQIVTSIKRDEQEGLLMPMAYDEEGKNPIYKLELLSTGGDRQFDTSGIVTRYDERIAMSMLADFILMGHQSTGSFALSTTKTNLFSNALSAILDVVAEEINLSGIPKLCLLNGYALDKIPTLSHGKLETSDLSKVSEFLKGLSAAGMTMFPNTGLENYLLELAGLPKNDRGEAGELPFPFDPMTGQPAGALIPGQLPGNAPLPTPGQPPNGRPSVNARPSDADIRPPANPKPIEQKNRKSSEGKKKRYVPLPQRVGRVHETLEALLDKDQLKTLGEAVLAGQTFTQLDVELREAILAAEAEE